MMTTWMWFSRRIGSKYFNHRLKCRKRWLLSRNARELCRVEPLEQRHLMAVVVPAYEITNQWGNEFEARITLTNVDVQPVNDWMLSFDYAASITDVWGATLVSNDGGRYVIANEGWNNDLETGRSLVFHLLGSTNIHATEIDAPTNYAINGKAVGDETNNSTPLAGDIPPLGEEGGDSPSNSNTDRFQVGFHRLRDWGEAFVGEITLTNHSSGVLTGWEISFDFTGGIDSLWNARLVNASGPRYTVRAPAWNQDLAAGGTVTIRFQATPEQEGVVPRAFVISGVCDGPLIQSNQDFQAPSKLQRPSIQPIADTIDGHGVVYAVGALQEDIQEFDPTVDRLDFGSHSARTVTLAKNEQGKVAFINPWTQKASFHVLSNVSCSDLTVDNFFPLDNEHLRQDIGGVLSWERRVGPRDLDTIYVRSHEVGVHERIEGFDPTSMKISLLYFGSRDRLFVEDTDEGLLISSEIAGQSILLVGVSKASLVGNNIEFHHDQVVESRLFVPFGFHADDVAIVSRDMLLTPMSVAGEPTDGHQVEVGNPLRRSGFFTEFASTTAVSVLVDADGLAYIQEGESLPIPVTRDDGYWQGNVPLRRDGATIMAAARDDLGRLRVLDGHDFNLYAWILDDNGRYIGEESPSDTSLRAKESLFQIDLDGDAVIETVSGVNSGNAGDQLWGEAFFAPYVDMGFWETPNLTEIATARGTSLLTLAFLLSTAEGKTAWAGWDSLALGSESPRAVAIDESIVAFQSAGGDVMISFGGAAGNSLAHVHALLGKSALDLANSYIEVVDKYSLNRIDFDIEGTAITDPVSIALRSEALALFQQMRPDVEVWYTLPAVPTGLTYNGHAVIRSALQAGVVLDGVNIMAMNFGEWAAPTTGPGARPMGFYAIASAQGAHDQLISVYAEYGHDFGWSQLGVTPMIGVNDITTQVFGVEDARMLEDFARVNGLGMLSMWSIARDNPGGLGQATATASGLDLPAGAFCSVFSDYGTQNTAYLYEEVSNVAAVTLLSNYLGRAYISESGRDPIAVSRSDTYWQGDVPLSRNGATMVAAARDHLGRLRVLDGNGVDWYAWILDESGRYIGEEGPTETTLAAKESLFQLDLNGDGLIGVG